MLLIGGVKKNIILLAFIAGLAYVLTFIDGVAPISKYVSSKGIDPFWNGVYVMTQQVSWWGAAAWAVFIFALLKKKSWTIPMGVFAGAMSMIAGYPMGLNNALFEVTSFLNVSACTFDQYRPGYLFGTTGYTQDARNMEYFRILEFTRRAFMQFIKDRFNYLFNSTKGLILVAIAMIALVTAIWGMLSGPMAEIGIRDIVIKLFKMDMVQAEREGRIIILYHSIAMAVVAIETYMITSLLKMKQFFKTAINAIITVGYIVTMIFGMGFAYFGHNWAFHGLYLFGLSLIFLAGVLLVIALWPWSKEYYQHDKAYARTKKGVDIERVAFFATALTTVISASFGAVPGSFLGNGFEIFLAENVIRLPEKTTMQYSIIGHLHIMLALIAIMITLIVGRWLNFKGVLHKIAMPLMILGTVVLNLGVWGVATPLEPIAHQIIYTGATPSMLAALLLLIWSWTKLIRDGTAHIHKPTIRTETRRIGSRSTEVWANLADALYELHDKFSWHLHGNPPG